MSASLQAQTPEIDMSRPHPARIYDYALGRKSRLVAANFLWSLGDLSVTAVCIT